MKPEHKAAAGALAGALICVAIAVTVGSHTNTVTGNPSTSYTQPDQRPTSGPLYDAAMERCALSRLKNAGVTDPTTADPSYPGAYQLCTYGTMFDSTSSNRGFGAADPGYWTP